MAGCGGNCACAQMNDKKDADTCATDGKTVSLDANGKCPCGKSADECCHKDSIKTGKNEALGELCEPHGDKHTC